MPKAKSGVWRFFASVKLALATLIVLAAISIIGTIIKQGQEPSYYVQQYGPNLARFMDALDITNMYRSWWFVSLLCLFAVNLVVCSIERLPRVWNLITRDNLSVDLQQLEKKSFTHRSATTLSSAAAAEKMQRIMHRAGWDKSRRQERETAILLFSQKGTWSRLGVYVVHLSILIILTGAITGTLFGLKAYVYLPEGRSTNKVFLQRDKQPVPLGFELRCDRYERTYYPNGMIKQYRIDLTVFDMDRQTPIKKSVIVNDPLSYRGFTFYQAESYPMEEYLVVIEDPSTGLEQGFRAPAEQEVTWKETGASFRIEDVKRDRDGTALQAKIRFKASAASEPSVIRMKDNGNATIRQSGKVFTLSFRQLFSTLLLVIKDPGILIVYFGCLLMIIGLAIVFFLSHRRMWIRITPNVKEQGSLILMSGTCNKNKPSFERKFKELVDLLEKEQLP